LRCGYCFYHGLAENRNIGSYGIMTKETADILIDKAVDAAAKAITFAFQGGEPSLAGLDFFGYFVDRVNKKIPASGKKLQVSYAIQTNGINISEELAGFFKSNNFLVGLSLDGVKEINDYFRVGPRGEGTHAKIIKTARLFDRCKVDYNILTVITAQTAKHIEKIYNYYKNQKFMYLQFIPCLEPLAEDGAPGAPQAPYCLTPELYERFLTTLFRLWHADFTAGKYISVRFFDNLVRTAAGGVPEQCGTLGFCSGQFVIEADGSVFPCDFYCVDNWKIGSIRDMSFEDLYNSPNMRKFRETSLYANYIKSECGECEVYYLCRGGCRRDRDDKKDGAAKENIYCKALYNFYSFAAPYLKEIIQILQKR